MPELPEVETIVRDLNGKVRGREIRGVWSDVAKFKIKGLKSRVVGRKIEKVERRGKNILFYLSGGKLLLVHQKMTGHLMYGKWKVTNAKSSKFKVKSLLSGPLEEKVNGFIHLIFYLDNGWQVALSDMRKFAKVAFFDTQNMEDIKDLSVLGPDALSVKFSDFEKCVLRKGGRDIKQVLMDQETIVGIGNIYADEILWKAKIYPRRRAGSLDSGELKKIFAGMRFILKKAVKKRGTSVSDFRDIFGKKGDYGNVRRAYGRKGEPCVRCGAKMEKIKVNGRGTCFCPKCQIAE